MDQSKDRFLFSGMHAAAEASRGRCWVAGWERGYNGAVGRLPSIERFLAQRPRIVETGEPDLDQLCADTLRRVLVNGATH